ncbi:hypothetical protein OE749_06975 [Aestuariibacter sp. AA17]|uniref:Uncharacterized protein n=1 Tax=Fluctibacter corallii TaxID=2984329 RepID=A0ABT3A774_9ALTE|nr:hypothetical protein [Aestuariibacter sp. AA17]MCV2884432.1 hypothetical protein [Aestuariibacter sp. AA17]
MKNVMLSIALATLFSASAQADIQSPKKVRFVGDVAYAGFCKAVVNDNVDLFKRSVRRFVGPLGGTKEEVLARVLRNDNVTCSGEGIKDFANQRNATDVVAYIEGTSA